MSLEDLDQSEGFVRFASWLFMGIGALAVAGGIILAFDDPGGIVLSLFGLVFAGMGYMAKRVFTTPAGKKRVVLEQQSGAIAGGSNTSVRYTHVDEDATDEQVAAVQSDWLREAWEGQVDWASGEILTDDVKHSGLHEAAAWAWCAFTGGAIVVGAFVSEIGWIVAVPSGGIAGVLSYQALRGRARRRKFGESRFRMTPCPATPGDTLEGWVLTGVNQGVAIADGFRLELRCVHRYETTEYRGSDRDRHTVWKSDVLWRADGRAAGRPSARRVGTLEVPVSFQLPADQKPASPGGGTDGILWELEAGASLPGLDYGATFKLPVLAPDVAARVRSARGG